MRANAKAPLMSTALLIVSACGIDGAPLTTDSTSTASATETSGASTMSPDDGSEDGSADGADDSSSGGESEGLACGTEALTFSDVDLGDVTLNVGCRGEGPTVLLLHGFPEFWYSWQGVVDFLPPDLRVVVPDLRGYNLSDKPEGLEPYEMDRLIEDVEHLIDATGEERVLLVAHDWGGLVSWTFAHRHPERLRGLVIMNAGHPDRYQQLLDSDPDQQAAAAYLDLFDMPGIEEFLAADDFAALADQVFTDAFTEADREAYREAWGRPGALEASLNWFRANPVRVPGEFPTDVTVDVPTLVLWGLADEVLVPANIEGLDAWVSDLRIRTFPEGTHWIMHDEPRTIADSVVEFVSEL